MGLGNPGRRYAATRHNIGARVLTALALGRGLDFHAGRGSFEAARMGFPGGEALLVLPTTFMNRSGIAGRELCELSGLQPDRILVLLDDLDLPLGRIRFRSDGSSGGHRGLGSLIHEWGRDDFPRLKLGIGRPEAGSVHDHVLGEFREQDLDRVGRIVEAAAEAILVYLENGLERAANRFNSLDIE